MKEERCKHNGTKKILVRCKPFEISNKIYNNKFKLYV